MFSKRSQDIWCLDLGADCISKKYHSIKNSRAHKCLMETFSVRIFIVVPIAVSYWHIIKWN